MRSKGLAILLLFVCCLSFDLQAQDNTTRVKKYEFSGYIKYMTTANFLDKADLIVTDQLIHERTNFRWWPHPNLKFDIEVRNRIHFGQLVQLTPNFASYLNNDDIYDMSWIVVERKSLVWHMMLDRAFVDYTKNKWQVTVGRQRINWGISLIWNPNDIFNAYNFYDFDYEERQGSDAVRIQYYTGVASSIEIAGKVATKKEDVVAALLWKVHKGSYDMQVLGGVAHQDITLGGGWAGNIKNAGFKGEFNYFHPYEKLDSFGVFTGTIGFDYSFPNSLFLVTGYLYNSNGSYHPNILNIVLFDVSAKNLSPYTHSFLVQASYPVTPLLNVGLATVYSPGDQAMFLNPTLTYSIKENWSIDLVSQMFFALSSNKYDLLGNSLFMRIKWSY